MLLCLSEHMSNTERITLVDKVKASSWLATFSIEPEHDLIGSCQWQRLSWEKNKTKHIHHNDFKMNFNPKTFL